MSMTAAMFRALEATDGEILIDGIEISTIGLHHLRRSLTLVPQGKLYLSSSSYCVIPVTPPLSSYYKIKHNTPIYRPNIIHRYLPQQPRPLLAAHRLRNPPRPPPRPLHRIPQPNKPRQPHHHLPHNSNLLHILLPLFTRPMPAHLPRPSSTAPLQDPRHGRSDRVHRPCYR